MVGWRKLAGITLVVLLAFVLTLLGKFSADWANLGTAAVIALAGGNAAEHLANAWRATSAREE
jgi:hypothetical protein